MTEHTPGPLTIAGPSSGLGSNDDGGDYAIVDRHGKIIAEVIHRVERGNDTRPALANARLFAAAPETKRQRDELLAMLVDNRNAIASLHEDALGWIRQEPRGPGDAWIIWAIRDQLVDQIDSLIDKVKGERP